LWNESLTPVERIVEPRDRIYASELGMPMVDRYLKMKGISYTNPPNKRALRKMQAGRFFEWIVAFVLKRADMIISREERVYSQIDGGLQVSGKLDFLGGGKPNFEKAKKEIEVYDLPDFVKYQSLAIIDKFDKIGDGVFEEMILEIKSVSSFVMNGVLATKEALPHHELQGYHYALNKKLPCNIVYICRDDMMLEEIPITDMENINKKYKSDILGITGYYKNNERPPLEPLIKWEFGKFKVNRGVEYSNYLQLLYGFETPEQYRAQVNKTVTSANRVVKRIIDGAKMTDKNKEAIEGIKKYYANFDELVDEAKELAKQGKLVEEEVEE
jgi:hypothetical protein